MCNLEVDGAIGISVERIEHVLSVLSGSSSRKELVVDFLELL